jgi:hypothetical protein
MSLDARYDSDGVDVDVQAGSYPVGIFGVNRQVHPDVRQVGDDINAVFLSHKLTRRDMPFDDPAGNWRRNGIGAETFIAFNYRHDISGVYIVPHAIPGFFGNPGKPRCNMHQVVFVEADFAGKLDGCADAVLTDPGQCNPGQFHRLGTHLKNAVLVVVFMSRIILFTMLLVFIVPGVTFLTILLVFITPGVTFFTVLTIIIMICRFRLISCIGMIGVIMVFIFLGGRRLRQRQEEDHQQKQCVLCHLRILRQLR